MNNLQRMLLLVGTASAIIGQLIVGKSYGPGVIFLGIALACALVEGWYRPRPLRNKWVITAGIALLGLAFWREPRGWFFLALALIEAGTSLRAPRPAPPPPVPTPAAEAEDELAAAAEPAYADDSPYHGAVETPAEFPFETPVVAPPSYFKASLFGLGTAAVGSVSWFLVTKVTGWQLGLVAWFVGRLVGRAVIKGAGGHGNGKLQVLAATLGGLGILGGYYLIIRDALMKVLTEKGMLVSEWRIFQAIAITTFKHPEIIGWFGAFFIVIGVYDAWRVARGAQAA